MANDAVYQYGVVSTMDGTFRFMYSGDPLATGTEFGEVEVHEVFNSLAPAGWEPYLSYPDAGETSWLMRRIRPAKELTPEEKKQYARPVNYRNGGHEEDEN